MEVLREQISGTLRPESDFILIRRIKLDDRLALNTLFAKYYPGLCHFALSMLKNREDAEEVVADVFFNCWNSRHKLAIEKNVKAYLFISVRNACLAKLKKVASHALDLRAVENSLAFSEQVPEEPAGRIHNVEHALALLPPRCRQVFVLSKLEGMKYKEISLLLNIAEKTVENHLVKALSILRSHFAVTYRHSPVPLHAEETNS